MNDMPTKLIKRNEKKHDVVPKHDYDELHKLYDEVVGIGYDLLDLIDERDARIEELEEENTDLRIKLGCQIEMSSHKSKKKFDGAVLSYNPRSRSLGIGLRFRDADE